MKYLGMMLVAVACLNCQAATKEELRPLASKFVADVEAEMKKATPLARQYVRDGGSEAVPAQSKRFIQMSEYAKKTFGLFWQGGPFNACGNLGMGALDYWQAMLSDRDPKALKYNQDTYKRDLRECKSQIAEK